MKKFPHFNINNMKFTIRFMFLLISLCMGFSATVFAAQDSPIGLWQTISDTTGKPAGLVQIWEANGELEGKVIQIYKQDGDLPTDRCVHCSGDRFNQPIEGMTIMWSMQAREGGVWNNGSILDPKTGSIYHCKIQLADNGDRLYVRGYILMPLIGRTQYWNRMTNAR